MAETYEQKIERKLKVKQQVIAVASGREKADLVLKNATYLNVFSNEFLVGDIAVSNGLIAVLENITVKLKLMLGAKLYYPDLLMHIFT